MIITNLFLHIRISGILVPFRELIIYLGNMFPWSIYTFVCRYVPLITAAKNYGVFNLEFKIKDLTLFLSLALFFLGHCPSVSLRGEGLKYCIPRIRVCGSLITQPHFPGSATSSFEPVWPGFPNKTTLAAALQRHRWICKYQPRELPPTLQQ